MRSNFVFDQLVNFIFPKACFLCEDELEQSQHICESCINELQVLTELELSQFNKDYLHKSFKKCFIPFQFDIHSQRLVHLLKYNYGKPIAALMSQLIFQQFAMQIAALNVDVIIPCPLHRRKLKEREYNQAELMAAELSKLTNIPMRPDLLLRTRYTKTQTRLNKAQREKNLNRSFSYDNRDNFKRIILIDDVITTGTTINKMAAAIVDANPKVELFALSFLSSIRR